MELLRITSKLQRLSPAFRIPAGLTGCSADSFNLTSAGAPGRRLDAGWVAWNWVGALCGLHRVTRFLPLQCPSPMTVGHPWHDSQVQVPTRELESPKAQDRAVKKSGEIAPLRSRDGEERGEFRGDYLFLFICLTTVKVRSLPRQSCKGKANNILSNQFANTGALGLCRKNWCPRGLDGEEMGI